jgi:hypothetical protein
VLTMHRAGLKSLVLVRREILLLVRIRGASLTFTTLAVFVSTTSVVALHAARPVGPALL